LQRKPFIKILLGGILFSLLLGGVPQWLSNPTSASAQEQEGFLLYTEDFDDNLAQGWLFNIWSEGGKWNVLDGVLIGSGATETQYLSAIFGDGSLLFSFWPELINDTLFVNLRINPEGPRYRVGINRIDDFTLDFTLWKQFGPERGDWEAIAESFVENLEGEHSIAITVNSGSIVIEWNAIENIFALVEANPTILEFKDPQPLPPGRIGFEVGGSNGEAVLDNIEFIGPNGSATYLFQGRVAEPAEGEKGRPLSGVTVSLIGANSPFPGEGKTLDRVRTEQDGRFTLEAPIGFEFYAIQETNPDGYESIDAFSPDGLAQTLDWIEFAWPLWGQILYGNEFWDQGPEPVVDDTPTRIPTSTDRPTSRPPTERPPEPETPEPPTESPPETPFVETPEPDDGDFDGRDLVLIIGGLAGLALMGGLGGYLLLRLIRRPPRPPRDIQPDSGGDEPPDDPGKKPVPLFIPPVRLLRVWLTEGASRGGRLVGDKQSM